MLMESVVEKTFELWPGKTYIRSIILNLDISVDTLTWEKNIAGVSPSLGCHNPI